MARGLPAVWSTLAGVPFIVGGGVYATETHRLPELGLAAAAFGAFVVAIGLYVHFVAAPAPPEMRESESLVARRHPIQRVASVKVVIGSAFLAVAWVLFYHTLVPYVYPTAALLGGLFLFSTGLHTYWTNSLTTYYVTTQRVIREYRLVALSRQEIPLDKVRGVTERRSAVESLVGLGNVTVASGDGGSLELVVRDLTRPSEFAEEIRRLL